MPPPDLISVVIPTLDEETRLGALLRSLTHQKTPHEVIVVDGGSSDGTVGLARRHGAILLQTDCGRGVQLRAGARLCAGDILLFLHADSVLAPGAFAAIRRALDADPECVGGNFRLLFDGETSFARRLDKFYAWIRRHGFYYGDSAIFLRRNVYEQIGGIRAIPLMEDYDLVRKLEKSGRTVCVEEPPLRTSSRKFEGRSSVSIVWGWLKIHALFHIGVSPERLARMYYGNSFKVAD